ANISDPQLASLARREQDLQQRINTLSELLTGLLSAPPDQQLPAVQAKIRTDITGFKSQREDLKKEIERKFPDYAELVEPKPASVERTQKALKPDEVLVSWYFGDNVGYVWAITKDKPAQFAQLSVGRAQMAKEVVQLRKALDPGVATIDEIPAFDVALANQLYQQVLAPVQSAFVGKKVLLTVPHAELGQLPLSLLVTKPTAQPAKGGATAFIGYKSVPWLTREIAVAQVPSVTALTALRSLPAGNPNRKNFIGFGDPYFSAQQEQQADKQAKATQLATRGRPLNLRSAPKTSGVSSAELALLPRLPDTSTELEEIGKAIGASDSDIYLHRQASVKQVMSTDLSNRKVVMFATHGLVPGELNGLTQPALALSSPDVTGDKDDGLLTMDKVLTLKLDADWVVLSACNTAAGEGAGSEAVSGLGRAFFFAGAKALLVSNWPVDSVASRTMMTDLFKSQQKAQGTSKAELLRQAMLNQIDQGGMSEGGSMKYAYAHPLFWAPFVVVGD
ncbi:CHAT domain-containing protein, partial [Polynucleobacter sp. UK-Kesae-W10]|uniref:CHAT domain-containing protein n=1 Tax=Polynucleobacter sp. UK-Kesae-W10 TaxID=1819738 RepID=UPI001C0E0659